MNISIFSFFSGAGFLDLGFEKEKMNIVFVNEFNRSFLDTYIYSRIKMKLAAPKFGYYCGDINDLLKGKQRSLLKENVSNSKKKSIVGFIGGPPCPDFSIAGKNEGISGKNGKLTNSYKKIILDQDPDFFVFENVKGLWSTKKHKEEYKKIKNSFLRKGYVLIDKLVNSIEYGVPQDRERVILFGIKYNLLSTDKAKARSILKSDFCWGNEKKYDREKLNQCNWPTTDPFVEDGMLGIPNNIIRELTIEYWFHKNDVYNHPNAKNYFKPRSINRFSDIEEGDVSRKSFKRLHRWRYSPTVAYGNNEVHLHPYKPRRLSVSEALAIQSLPKEYEIPDMLSLSEMFKTVGNGVPFLLSKAIAKQIKAFIDKNVNRR